VPSSIDTVRSQRKIRVITPPVAVAGLAAQGPAHANPQAMEFNLPPGQPPWHAAYEEFERRGGNEYVEAELQIPFPAERLEPLPAEAFALGPPTCEQKPQSTKAPMGPERAWHLGQQYSQLAAARDYAATQPPPAKPIRIAHIDTGYYANPFPTPAHLSTPARLLRDLSRDFTVDPPKQFAVDPGGTGAPFDNRGHGTATLAILAGGMIAPFSSRPTQKSCRCASRKTSSSSASTRSPRR